MAKAFVSQIILTANGQLPYGPRACKHAFGRPSTSFMSDFSIAQLALPGVVALISVLAYGSQILFLHIEPSPLAKGEARSFNLLICCIWVCYFRACFTNPGSVPAGSKSPDARENGSSIPDISVHQRQRWCRKCNAAKPPRAHHCKTCGR